MLMDDAQHFTLVSDSTKPGEIKFTGSPDNDVFAAYSSFLAKISPKLKQLAATIKNGKKCG